MLRELLARRDRTDVPEHFAAEDTEFRLTIVRAARNPVLLEMYRYLVDRFREGLSMVRFRADITESGPEAHRALLDAIEQGDADAAALAARAVIESSRTSLDGMLDRQKEGR